MRILPILAGLIAGIVISGAVFWVTGFSLFGNIHSKPLPHNNASNEELIALAFDIIEDIKAGDYEALSGYVHPEYGVVFSPSSTINLSANKCFRADQIASFSTDSNVYVWGVYSSGGEPIEMTPNDYINKFVFGKDYTTASVIGVNHVVRSGNALENMKEIFPDARFVDFHITGGERYTADDPDWSSLRLGFEEYDGALMLTLILHSEWTG